jgi:hypothetical protein
VAALAGGTLTGCTKKVDEGDVEGKLASELQQQLGQRPAVDCPGDQTAKRGTRFRCTATIGKQRLPVDVELTARDRFTYQVRPAGK